MTSTQEQNEKRVHTLSKLLGYKPGTPFEEVLKDPLRTVSALSAKYTNKNTIRSYVISAFVIARQHGLPDDTVHDYKVAMERFRDHVNKKKLDNVMTENMVHVTQLDIKRGLIKFVNFIKDKYDTTDVFELPEHKDKPRIRKSWERDINEMMLLVWYSYQEPTRRELNDVSLVHEGTKINYIKDGKYHVNDFKNVKKLGPQVIDLHPKTNEIINKYKDIGATRLFRYKNYNAFGDWLQRVFKKHLGIEGVTVNVLRHSRASEIIQHPQYNQMTNAQKEKIHNRMLHSAKVAMYDYNLIQERIPDIVFETPRQTGTSVPSISFF